MRQHSAKMEKPRFSALCKVVALLCAFACLAGCARQEPTVITIQTTDSMATTDMTQTQQNSYIAPAPGDAADQWEAPSEQRSISSTILSSNADLVIGTVVGDEASIHPLRTKFNDFNSVNGLVFEGLFRLDDALKPVPMLAESWSVEGKEWTFTLRSGIQFHNGRPLTANDVVASYQDALGATDTAWYPLLSQIEDMYAQDELTVKVLSRGMGYMILYSMTFPVVETSSISTEEPKGTGPYWYIGGYDALTGLVHLESNPLWWRRPSDTVHTIYVRTYHSTIEALSAIDTGEIDILATKSNAASLSKTLSDRITMDYSTMAYECVVPNCNDDILSSKNVRVAVMYAMNRSMLANSAYLGMVQESEVPVTPGSWLYDAQATRYNYSPERALQFLYEDGWKDINGDGVLEKEISGTMRELRLTLMTYNEGASPVRTEAAYAIADQLSKVGFAVQVEVKSRENLGKALQDGMFQLALVSYNMSWTPHLAFFLSPSGSMNFSKYSSESMDIYLRDAYEATTEEALIAAMSKVQMKTVEDLPIMGLFFRTGVTITTRAIAGLHGLREGETFKGLELAQFE